MRNYLKKYTFLTLILFITANVAFAQNKDFPAPREEKLLNGLKVLIWNQPNSGRVSVNLRIHSGSAFDPVDKDGTMALFSDILFPDEGAKQYFEDELEGKLEIITTHDYMQINASAKSDEFLSVMETLSAAIINTQINKETVEKAKKNRLERIAELEKDPNYIANTAIAKRFFGEFPYGRPTEGTSEGITKNDFPELVIAKQRFITADNSTISISGDVQSSFAYRAARRLFGGWQKSLKLVPANFRLPVEPDKNLKIIPTTIENISELRFASKGVARNNDNYYSNLIYAKVLENRMGTKSSVELAGNLLPSYVVYKMHDWNVNTVKMVGNSISLPGDIDGEITLINKEKISEQEFTKAKNEVIAEYNKKDISELYFDVDTYKLKSVKDDWKALQSVKLNDVSKVAEDWNKEDFVKVLVVSKKEEVIKQDSDPKDPEK